ncbi:MULTISPECIES: hypothetical protein [Actinomadura]|uniref:Uncharacterized protein n=1 Tax=Actinomadura yumaensis TaxID=111807 RepID=A0ABW2D3J6_9ACTN|nr:hypothetical protein [Actinomadura sp. J1-007]MWK35524.1 hypothetical protein [Actinomadura sp. J1-007]
MDYTPPLTITGWVHISYGQYYLMAHGAGEPEPPTEDGLILSNEADEGSLYIASETQHGKIRLIVRVYDREPSLDSGEWDHIESSEIRAESADIDVIKWGGGSPPGFTGLADSGPGLYEVRVYRRRRLFRPEDVSPEEESDRDVDIEDGMREEHLIEMWLADE